MIAEAGESTVVSVSVNSARPALQPFIVEAAYHVLPGEGPRAIASAIIVLTTPLDCMISGAFIPHIKRM